MSCDRIQSRLSRAIDDRRDLSAFEGHLAVCSDCDAFASTSLEFAGHYRSRVLQGIGRLRGAAPSFEQKYVVVLLKRVMLLAASVLVLLSVPLPPAPVLPPASSARVPLFDEVRVFEADLHPLVWSGEPRLPGRLDADLPASLHIEIEPIALPRELQF